MGPPDRIVTIKRSGLDGQHFPLSLSSCLFGRGVECDIRIQLPVVSRQHCRIEISGQQATLLNFSTVNPTLLNGAAIAEPVLLRHGDIITIVDRSFRYEKGNQSSGSLPATPLGQSHEQVPQRRASGPSGAAAVSTRPDGAARDSGARSDITKDPVPASPQLSRSCVGAEAAPGPEAQGDTGGNMLTLVRAAELAGAPWVSRDGDPSAPAATPGPQSHSRNASPFRRLYESMKEDLDARAEKENLLQAGRKATPRRRSAAGPDTPRPRHPAPKAPEPRRKSGSRSLTPAGPALGQPGAGEEVASSPDQARAGTPKAESPARPPRPSSSRKRRREDLGVYPGVPPTSADLRGGLPAEDEKPLASQRAAQAGVASPVGGSAQLLSRKREHSPSQPAEVGVQSPAVLAPLLVQEERKPQSGLPGLSTLDASALGDPLNKPEGLPLKRRRVSFGGHLRPELFDENLPPNTPLKRGETPARRRSLAAPTPAVLKKIIKEQPQMEGKAAPPRPVSPAPEEQRRRSARASPAPGASDAPRQTDSQRRAGRRSGQHGLLRMIYSRRRSGASEANLMVARSWADVVKLGAKQTQQAKAARQPTQRQPPGRKQKRPPTPKRPEVPAPSALSTGHANSPCTITVGRATLPKPGIPTRPPVLLSHLTFHQKPDFSEDLSGLTEMFKTPARQKSQRKSLHLSARPGPEDVLQKPTPGLGENLADGSQRAAELPMSSPASPMLRRQSARGSEGAVSTPRGTPASPAEPLISAGSARGPRRSGERRGSLGRRPQEREPERDVTESRSASHIEAKETSRKTSRRSKSSEMRQEMAADLAGQKPQEMEAKEEQTDSLSLCRTPGSRPARENKAEAPFTTARAGPGATPGTGRRLKSLSQKGDKSPHTPGVPTAPLTDDDKQMTLVQQVPVWDVEHEESVTGSGRRSRTPRRQALPLEDLDGLSQLFNTPAPTTKPVTEQASETPSTAPKPEPVSTPARTSRQLKTPSQKRDKSLGLTGSPHTPGVPTDTQHTPELKLEPAETKPSSRRRSRTPRRQATSLEGLDGVSQLFKTPSHGAGPATGDLGQLPEAQPVDLSVSERRLQTPEGKAGTRVHQPEHRAACEDAPLSKGTPGQKRKSGSQGTGKKRHLGVPKEKTPGLEDLSGLSELFQTPVSSRIQSQTTASRPATQPELVAIPVGTSRRLKTPSQKGDKALGLTGSPHTPGVPTPPLTDDDKQMTLVQQVPVHVMDPEGSVSRSRRRSRTPKRQASALDDLDGVSQLFQTPAPATKPETEQVSETPGTTPKPEPVSTSRRLKTPSKKRDASLGLTGSPHTPGVPTSTQQTAVQRLKPAETKPGSRKRSRTPRRQTSSLEDLDGVSQLFQTPAPATKPVTEQASEMPSTAPEPELVASPVRTSRQLETPSRKRVKSLGLTVSPYTPGAPTPTWKGPVSKSKLTTETEEAPEHKAETAPGSRRRSRTPRRQASALEDLDGVSQLFQTPAPATKPLTEQASEMPSTAVSVSTPASTSRRLETPSRKRDKSLGLTGSPHTHTYRGPVGSKSTTETEILEQKLELTETEPRSRKRSRTPRRQTSALEDLDGVSQLFQTPAPTTKPVTEQASETPSTAPEPEPVSTPASTGRRLKTASRKRDKSLGLAGSPHPPGVPTAPLTDDDKQMTLVQQMPVWDLEPEGSVTGSGRRSRTPGRQALPLEDLDGISQLFKTPGPTTKPETEQASELHCTAPEPEPVSTPVSARRQFKTPSRKRDKSLGLSGSPHSPGAPTPTQKGPVRSKSTTETEILEQKLEPTETEPGSRRRSRTPRRQSSALEDLDGLSQLFQTPAPASETPSTAVSVSTPASASRRLETPSRKRDKSVGLTGSPHTPGVPTDTQHTPELKLEPAETKPSNRRRSRTPRRQATSLEGLDGVSQLFKTPSHGTGPATGDLCQLPEAQPVDLSVSERRLQTPEGKAGTRVHQPEHRAACEDAPLSKGTPGQKRKSGSQGAGRKRHLGVPKEKTPDLEDLSGLSELFQTPVLDKEPSATVRSKTPYKSPKPDQASVTPASTDSHARTPVPTPEVEAFWVLVTAQGTPGATPPAHEDSAGGKEGIKLLTETPEKKPGVVGSAHGRQRQPGTPKVEAVPLEDLAGLRELFETPVNTGAQLTVGKASQEAREFPEPTEPSSKRRRIQAPAEEGAARPAQAAGRRAPQTAREPAHTELRDRDPGPGARRVAVPRQKADPVGKASGSKRQLRTARQKAADSKDLASICETSPRPAPTDKPWVDVGTSEVSQQPQDPESVGPAGRTRRPRAAAVKGAVEEAPAVPVRSLRRAGRAGPAVAPLEETAQQKVEPEDAPAARRQRRAPQKQQPTEEPADFTEHPQEPVTQTTATTVSQKASWPKPASRAGRLRAPLGTGEAEEAPPALSRPPIRAGRATRAHREALVDDPRSVTESADQEENIGSRRPLRAAQKKAQLPGDPAECTYPGPASGHREAQRTEQEDKPSESSGPEAVIPTGRARRLRAPTGKVQAEQVSPALRRPPIRTGRAAPVPSVSRADGPQLLDENTKQEASSREEDSRSRKPLRAGQKKAQLQGDKDSTGPSPASAATELPKTGEDEPGRSSEAEAVVPAGRARRARAVAGKRQAEEAPLGLARPPLRTRRAAPASEGPAIRPLEETAQQKVEPVDAPATKRQRSAPQKQQPKEEPANLTETPSAPEHPQEPVTQTTATTVSQKASRPEPASRARRPRTLLGTGEAEEAPPALSRPPIRAGRAIRARKEPEGQAAVPMSLESTAGQNVDLAESKASSRRQPRASKAVAPPREATSPVPEASSEGRSPSGGRKPVQAARRALRLLKAESGPELEASGASAAAESDNLATAAPPGARPPAGYKPAAKRLRFETPPRELGKDRPVQKRCRGAPGESDGLAKPPEPEVTRKKSQRAPRSETPPAQWGRETEASTASIAQARPLRTRHPQPGATEEPPSEPPALAGKSSGGAKPKGTKRQVLKASGGSKPDLEEAGAQTLSTTSSRPGRHSRTPLPSGAEAHSEQSQKKQTGQEESAPRGTRARKPAASSVGDTADGGPRSRAARGTQRRVPGTGEDEDPVSAKKVRTRSRLN